MMEYSTLLVFLLINSSLCLSAQEFSGPQGEIDTILSNVKSFSENVVASDHVAIGEFYTVDAKIFPQRVEIIEGREDVTTYWERPDDVRILEHVVTPAEITIVDEVAYDYGHYEGTTRQADGSENSWRGKYVIIWKKIHGEWKIYLDIWNGIAPQHRLSASERRCINSVMDLDSFMGEVRNHAPERMPLSTAIRNYVDAMARYDMDRCPTDFKTAFAAHRSAWSDMVEVTDAYPDLNGEMHELFDELKKGKEAEAFDRRLKAIFDSWEEVEKASN